MQFSRKKCFFFVHIRKCTHNSNCSYKLSHTLSDSAHPNINFLISKQNEAPKIDPKMVFPFLDMLCLLNKQKKLYSQINRQINTSSAMNCIYFLPCFFLIPMIYRTRFHVWYIPGSNIYV